MREQDFGDKLAALCAAEMVEARKDADRMGAMIERLAASLGFTVCVAARGNPAGIEEMLTGAEGYAHAEAVAKAPMVRFLNDPTNAVRSPPPMIPDLVEPPCPAMRDALRIMRLYLLASDIERFNVFQGTRSQEAADDIRALLTSIEDEGHG